MLVWFSISITCKNQNKKHISNYLREKPMVLSQQTSKITKPVVFRIHPTFGDGKFPTPCAICVSHQSSRIFNPSGEFRTSTAQAAWGCCWNAVLVGDDAPGFDGGNTASYQSIKIGLHSTNRKFIASVCENQDPKNPGKGVNTWCFYNPTLLCSLFMRFASVR